MTESSPSLADAAAQAKLFRSAEAKVFSQFQEDGILKLLIDRIGAGSRRFVEFGIGNGKECNTANLSIFGGWGGLLMDGNAADVEKARRYYASRPEVAAGQVNIISAFVTAENINGLLTAHAGGAADLLSIDVDGIDLWIWRAINVIDPQIVIMEYNASFGPTRSITVCYDPQFDRHRHHASGFYHGASLAALAKVGQEKGYVLVGCESHGLNAFFVKRDLVKGAGLVEMTSEQAFYEHAWRKEKLASEAQFDVVKEMEFVEI